DPYEVLTIQPGGQIALRNDFIGNANQPIAQKKFSAYLRLAAERNCDLVLSPEYSCPWDVLTNAIQSGQLPGIGKLWALGCEAITPQNLQSIKDSIRDIVWIHEDIPTTQGNFLDPLCYLLKAMAESGEFVNVAILQFKTLPMADPK